MKKLLLLVAIVAGYMIQVTAQKEVTEQIPMFGTDTENYSMPANSLSEQFKKLYLTAKTETAIAQRGQSMIPVLVKFTTAQGATPAAIAQANAVGKQALMTKVEAKTSATVRRTFKYSPYVSMMVTVDDLKSILDMDDVVEVVEDQVSHPMLNKSLGQIGANIVHDSGLDGSGAAVAILDTGTDPDHPMFSGRIVASACFGTTGVLPGFFSAVANCPNGQDEQVSLNDGSAGENCNPFFWLYPNGVFGCFHGNHVAGIAAGSSWDVVSRTIGPIELKGVAPAADIIGINVFSTFDFPDGTRDVLSFTTDQIAALEWVYDNHQTYNIAAANMSLGGGQNFTSCDGDPRFGIISMLRAAGVATVIATGNNGFDDAIGQPACITPAVAVGSVNGADEPSTFSNFASGLVDLVAPGENIISAFGTDGSDDYFFPSSGTSMATPHVAGAFTVLKAAFPDATVDEIESALKETGLSVTFGASAAAKASQKSGANMVPRINLSSAYQRMVANRAPIPTLGEWGVISLGLLLMIFGLVAARKTVYARA